MSPRTLYALAAAALVSGCMPLINHTPRVVPGHQSTLTTDIAWSDIPRVEGSRQNLLPIPAISYRQAVAWRPSSNPDLVGIEGAIEGSIFNGLLVDLYAQAPHAVTGTADAGVGLAAAAGFFKGLMTYLQGGRRFTDRYYVFTTQNIAWLRRSGGGPRRVLWQPTLALDGIGSEDGSYAVFLTIVVGPTADPCRTQTACSLVLIPGARVAFGVSRYFPPSFARR